MASTVFTPFPWFCLLIRRLWFGHLPDDRLGAVHHIHVQIQSYYRLTRELKAASERLQAFVAAQTGPGSRPSAPTKKVESRAARLHPDSFEGGLRKESDDGTAEDATLMMMALTVFTLSGARRMHNNRLSPNAVPINTHAPNKCTITFGL